ncbi:hypothetical protein HMPREF0372_02002 [Flavonifractor plautii ATCC 29863]|uniref:Uncharacterized protein n=1 Tax=Flavonifractor plautii ATCC 29863 TaxID=411475 RepID=G9YR59_FLAPL|nr:hypothetical protein HMPREF0372_02002 [Flavonifractor plautii ATCC 29863]
MPLWGNSPSAYIGPAIVETGRTLSGFMELLTPAGRCPAGAPLFHSNKPK